MKTNRTATPTAYTLADKARTAPRPITSQNKRYAAPIVGRALVLLTTFVVAFEATRAALAVLS